MYYTCSALRLSRLSTHAKYKGNKAQCKGEITPSIAHMLFTSRTSSLSGEKLFTEFKIKSMSYFFETKKEKKEKKSKLIFIKKGITLMRSHIKKEKGGGHKELK